MSPQPGQERWQRIKHLFQAAFELPPPERAGFLDRECGSDAATRTAVEKLLASHDEAADFMESSPTIAPRAVRRNGPTVDQTGRRVGPYRILERIGSGGMGVVYRAQDTRLGRDAALKFLPHDLAGDPIALERFAREARAASSLNHPNICTIYGIEEEQSEIVIAMELLEGVTLGQRIGGRPMPLSDLVDIAIQAADALEAARARGLIHRDIKPSNIFITNSGMVKILDFGLAKPAPDKYVSAAGSTADSISHQLTGAGLAIGTMAYMSPEQARGDKLDARTDLFSLGAVIYEMAAGSAAFRGATSALIFDAILNKTPDPVRKTNPAMPAELELIISKALEKDREVRYQTASDLRADLKRLKRDSESGRITRMLYPDRMLAAPRRKFNWVTFMVVLAIMVALATLALWKPQTAPRVLRTIQLTKDGRDKMLYLPASLVTDGSRLYFSEQTANGNIVPAQCSVNGRETVEIASPFQNTGVLDVWPEHSELLVVNFTRGDPEFALWVLPLVGGSPRRVGNIMAHAASWTPDHSGIVYANGHDVFLAAADGANIRKVVTANGSPWWPRMSPDGRRIRFGMSRGNSDSIMEVRTDGSGLHALLPGFAEPPSESSGNWTPDGRYFVFQSGKDENTNIWALRERRGLFDGGRLEPFQLTAGPINFGWPVAARDGRRLFVEGDNRQGELMRFNPANGTVSAFLGGISAEGVDFSRDGQWVCYISYPDGSLWRSRLDNSERMQLTTPPLRGYQPRWSPDGSRIVFMGLQPGKTWKLFIVPAEGGTALPLLNGDPRVQADPSWSADGNAIVYGRWPFNEENPPLPHNILSVGLQSMRITPVPGSEDLWSPQVSPDGRHISAVTGRSDRLKIYDVRTQKWSEIVVANAGFLNWTRDSSAVYFRSQDSADTALYRYTLAARKLERLGSIKFLRLTGSISKWIGLAPDNSPLVLRNSGNQEIYAIDWEAP